MNDGKGVSGKVRLYWELSRARAREGHKSALRQWAEMAALAVVTGNGPGFYQMAGFWRASVSWREKRAHLNAAAAAMPPVVGWPRWRPQAQSISSVHGCTGQDKCPSTPVPA